MHKTCRSASRRLGFTEGQEKAWGGRIRTSGSGGLCGAEHPMARRNIESEPRQSDTVLPPWPSESLPQSWHRLVRTTSFVPLLP